VRDTARLLTLTWRAFTGAEGSAALAIFLGIPVASGEAPAGDVRCISDAGLNTGRPRSLLIGKTLVIRIGLRRLELAHHVHRPRVDDDVEGKDFAGVGRDIPLARVRVDGFASQCSGLYDCRVADAAVRAAIDATIGRSTVRSAVGPTVWTCIVWARVRPRILTAIGSRILDTAIAIGCREVGPRVNRAGYCRAPCWYFGGLSRLIARRATATA
jgi:hypothetical protein